ncbi:MAG: hypothetical protein ACQEWV_16940 [Bacillota bacterium]
MDTRRLVIFTLILIFICSIGSAYIFKKDVKPPEMHIPQRKIERQLSLPHNAAFIQTQIDDLSISNKKSVNSIKEKFQRRFETLQNETNKKIDSLFSKATNEYKSQIKKEEVLLTDLYQKYAVKGQELEQQTNEAFYSLHQELINELKQNGYSQDYADEFEEKFIQHKKERESQILKMALSIVG